MNTCPTCGKSLTPDAPSGLCAACLVRRAMAPASGGSVGAVAGEAKWTPPEIPDLAPEFSELEIVELLGRGGMGAVYKVRQRSLGRFAALKILPPHLGESVLFADRFAREARALARLNHPSIVTLYEFGQTKGGLYFFLMEFVDGVTLRELISGERVGPREALAIVPQVCDALQYAHDNGIIHRDIKPENILLDRLGRVKVADFGLAKLMEEPGPEKSESHLPGPTNSQITDVGRCVGTPDYIAPEQAAEPRGADHRADIYALGVVFYQMLTGELPTSPVAPPSRKVVVDVRLDEIVMRALENEPAMRYQSAGDFKTQIESVIGEYVPRVAPTRRRISWRRFAGFGILLLVPMSILAFLWLSGAFQSGPPPVPVVSVQSLAAYKGDMPLYFELPGIVDLSGTVKSGDKIVPAGVLIVQDDKGPAILEKFKIESSLPATIFSEDRKATLANGTLLFYSYADTPKLTGYLGIIPISTEHAVFTANQSIIIRIDCGIKDDALLIPTSAVQKSGHTSVVYVVDSKKSSITMRTISTGNSWNDQTEVTSGLTTGESVVTLADFSTLKTGSRVHASPAATPSTLHRVTEDEIVGRWQWVLVNGRPDDDPPLVVSFAPDHKFTWDGGSFSYNWKLYNNILFMEADTRDRFVVAAMEDGKLNLFPFVGVSEGTSILKKIGPLQTPASRSDQPVTRP